MLSLTVIVNCPNYLSYLFETFFLIFALCSYRLSRQSVPDAQVPWSSSFPSYDPPSFTAPFVLTAEWADKEIKGGGEFKWNALDGKVNRKSHEGPYSMSEGEPKAPLNVRGRTGMKGRGVLGRWGPNHAADPVVTRWKRGEDGK